LQDRSIWSGRSHQEQFPTIFFFPLSSSRTHVGRSSTPRPSTGTAFVNSFVNFLRDLEHEGPTRTRYSVSHSFFFFSSMVNLQFLTANGQFTEDGHLIIDSDRSIMKICLRIEPCDQNRGTFQLGLHLYQLYSTLLYSAYQFSEAHSSTTPLEMCRSIRLSALFVLYIHPLKKYSVSPLYLVFRTHSYSISFSIYCGTHLSDFLIKKPTHL
jgi:hypothetical protein